MTSRNPIATGYSPFKICPYCSREFGSLSLPIHEKVCKRKPKNCAVPVEKRKKRESMFSSPARQQTKAPRQQSDAPPPQKLTSSSICPSTQSRKPLVPVMDPGSAQETRAPRPKTAIKSHSSLLASGYEVPVICNELCTSTEHGVVCSTCGECVPSFRYDVHRRTCPSAKNRVSTGNIVFPRSAAQSTCTEEPQAAPRKTATHVACSVCGRKYGSKSIAIHEPQCIKKRQLQCRRLPPEGERPLPAVPRPPVDDRKICARNDADMAEAYFQYCYAEFEKDLLPCGKCGRSFAPERHKKHILNCNAKPLVTTLQT